MKKFRDNLNQDWVIELTLGEVRRLRGLLGLDLFHPQHHLQVLHSLTDRIAFVCLLCEKQRDEYEISIDEFEERLTGQGFAHNASIAFLEELSDFFRRYGQEAQARLNERSLKVMREGNERITTMTTNGEFDSLLDSAETELERLLRSNAGNGSQNSPPTQE